jgi:hypothetical protein
VESDQLIFKRVDNKTRDMLRCPNKDSEQKKGKKDFDDKKTSFLFSKNH